MRNTYNILMGGSWKIRKDAVKYTSNPQLKLDVEDKNKYLENICMHINKTSVTILRHISATCFYLHFMLSFVIANPQ